jgi:hypothetical protein
MGGPPCLVLLPRLLSCTRRVSRDCRHDRLGVCQWLVALTIRLLGHLVEGLRKAVIRSRHAVTWVGPLHADTHTWAVRRSTALAVGRSARVLIGSIATAMLERTLTAWPWRTRGSGIQVAPGTADVSGK